jgi:NTE family protein
MGDATIQSLAIPFSAVAVDIKRHTEVVFSSGSLMKAIRASISIPTVFLPVSYDHSLLVDGGVLNPLPLDIVKRTEGDLLVSVNVNSPEPYKSTSETPVSVSHEQGYLTARETLNKRWSELINRGRNTSKPKPLEMGMFDLVSESINLMQHKISLYSIEKFKPAIVVNIPYKIATVYDFYKAETLIEAGREACRTALASEELKVQLS